MTRHTPKRLRYSVLVSLIGLVLSGFMSAPGALAQEEPLILEINITGATLDRSGVVTVTGTVTCTEPAQLNFLTVYVTQPVGRTGSVNGNASAGGAVGQCEPTAPFNFSMAVTPYNGRFVPGQTFFNAFVDGCAPDSCDSDDIIVSRRLRH